jgi:hypothetical protein
MTEKAEHKPDSELTEEEMRSNAIRLAFEGDESRFEEFCGVLEEHIPEDSAAVLGGSSVTGHRHKDDAPFDAEGPGSSDIDVYLIGNSAIDYFGLEGFWIPGIHSHPVKDGDEEIAPGLKPLRHKLKKLAGREVTLQASQSFYYWFREKLLGQPYLLLAGTLDTGDDNAQADEL